VKNNIQGLREQGNNKKSENVQCRPFGHPFSPKQLRRYLEVEPTISSHIKVFPEIFEECERMHDAYLVLLRARNAEGPQ